ncbi:ABC transporter permease [Ascidiimonas sp. W6]|uniref:ABC transporter permease n=1 Tax=Ascidiimonas meishanensis TaxID=3128903 RepID=UPI0030EDB702
MNYLQLALRNIKRHGNRSVVTILTICLGFTALGVIGGVVTNIFSRLKQQAIIVEKLGHLTFAQEGYFENNKMEPEKYLWNKKQLDEILEVIKNDPEVELATPRLSLFGIASNGKASTIFITEGVIPEDDEKLMNTPVDGRTKPTTAISISTGNKVTTEVAIGSELSQNLGLGKGEYFTLLTTTKDGMANAVDTDIIDVYNTGNPATNDKFVLTNFNLAQELYDTDGAQRIVVTVKDDKKLDEVKTRLLASLKAKGHDLEAKDWEELSLFYGRVTKMFGIIFRVLMAIISVVVLLTLLNTMQMAVSERTREIGTMRAIGMLRKKVIFIFCIEGLVMAFLGCLVAVPILLGISGLLQALDVSFIPPVGSAPVPITLIFKPFNIILVTVLFSIAALVSSYTVSRRISRQPVVDSLLKIN